MPPFSRSQEETSSTTASCLIPTPKHVEVHRVVGGLVKPRLEMTDALELVVLCEDRIFLIIPGPIVVGCGSWIWRSISTSKCG